MTEQLEILLKDNKLFLPFIAKKLFGSSHSKYTWCKPGAHYRYSIHECISVFMWRPVVDKGSSRVLQGILDYLDSLELKNISAMKC